MLAFAMAAGFTRAQVETLAALANLELTPAEVDLFARQLGDILAYADEVQQVDTTGIPPTAHVATRHASDRPDQVGPSLDRDAALANAPDAARGAGAGFFFKVPRVIG
jgi:aspartyl-tRNA(Asn)/glutamyl-tRNA(Gln) amidotransferase subunit C